MAVCLGIAAVLSSCGNGAKRVDAMVGDNGKPSGIIIEYRSEIDLKSIDNGTYQVPGYVVFSYFASNSNPFKKEKEEKDQKPQIKGRGRYVVLFLKEDPNGTASATEKQTVELSLGRMPDIDVRVKQVAPVTTSSGRVIKPWDKSLKPTNYYVVNGGLSK